MHSVTAVSELFLVEHSDNCHCVQSTHWRGKRRLPFCCNQTLLHGLYCTHKTCLLAPLRYITVLYSTTQSPVAKKAKMKADTTRAHKVPVEESVEDLASLEAAQVGAI